MFSLHNTEHLLADSIHGHPSVQNVFSELLDPLLITGDKLFQELLDLVPVSLEVRLLIIDDDSMTCDIAFCILRIPKYFGSRDTKIIIEITFL